VEKKRAKSSTNVVFNPDKISIPLQCKRPRCKKNGNEHENHNNSLQSNINSALRRHLWGLSHIVKKLKKNEEALTAFTPKKKFLGTNEAQGMNSIANNVQFYV